MDIQEFPIFFFYSNKYTSSKIFSIKKKVSRLMISLCLYLLGIFMTTYSHILHQVLWLWVLKIQHVVAKGVKIIG